ncbi:GNAT family N-acetyltransferase [Cryptosporangium japonicum]|uniref:N-acetyltransferase domain-containing protein n=1 Tax=Cryptosporangium japonicum TaxID=80872 RepID=A0ABN0UD11_9ACTN
MSLAYVDNAIAMWSALEPSARTTAGTFVVDRARINRRITRAPAPVDALVAAAPRGVALVVEDVFGTAVTEPVTTLRMPVMTRPPGPIAPAAPPGTRVVRVTGTTDLADAERVIVDGFPQRAYLPWSAGEFLPPSVLGLPGWHVWLAFRHDVPAAAAYTYDDGHSIGVYSLATLPGHRGAGLARSVLTAALAAGAERASTLTATEAGVPLYESLGYRTEATTTWHLRSPH